MKKAADSVILNIGEGSNGQTIPGFQRFLDIALRSAIEVVACLYLASKENKLPKIFTENIMTVTKYFAK
jgi:four helix bundle protein